MLISLENAGVQRSDKWLVRGVTMQIERGRNSHDDRPERLR